MAKARRTRCYDDLSGVSGAFRCLGLFGLGLFGLGHFGLGLYGLLWTRIIRLGIRIIAVLVTVVIEVSRANVWPDVWAPVVIINHFEYVITKFQTIQTSALSLGAPSSDPSAPLGTPVFLILIFNLMTAITAS